MSIDKTLARLGLTVETEFVPWSKSRNYKPGGATLNERTLNWKVTLKKEGEEILTTDYSAGIAHCPGYKAFGKYKLTESQAIEAATELGYVVRNRGHGECKEPINPDTKDVIYSLTMDSDVIEHDGFKDWAENLGYDTDSRKAEAIFKACLGLAKQMKDGLGETMLEELRETFQDY